MSLRWSIAQAAEWRWWRRYLRGKSKDAYLDWKREYWKKFISDTNVTIPAGCKVLDAGCGPAGVFIVLPQAQVTAIDPLLDKYAGTLPHFDRKDYPWVQFQTVSLEQFKPTDTFDLVFCLNAINHVADLDLALDQLLQPLNPGGVLVLSIDAHNHPFFKKIFQWLPGDILHPHQYDLREYQDMLTRRGLRIEATHLKDQAFLFNYYVLVARNLGGDILVTEQVGG